MRIKGTPIGIGSQKVTIPRITQRVPPVISAHFRILPQPCSIDMPLLRYVKTVK